MLAHIADSIGDPREMSNPPDMLKLKEDDALVRGFESGLSSIGRGGALEFGTQMSFGQ